MSSRSLNFRLVSSYRLAAVVWLAVGFFITEVSARAEDGVQAGQKTMAAGSMSGGGMAHMSGHMYMTTLRTPNADDHQKADAIVAAAKEAMEPYRDYRKALADGYEIFLPNIPQPQYHFTRNEYGRAAWTHFDPLKPTSLLYKKTADGGYTLVSAMYTDRVDANEDELNERIPLSIARWHHTSISAKRRQDRRPHILVPMRSLACSGQLRRGNPVKRREACFFRTSSDGWFMCIRMRATQRRSGRQMMTTRDTTIWITR